MKISGSLWNYYKDMPVEADKAAITVPKSFKSKVKITRKPSADGNKKDAEIVGSLKYLYNFW